MPVSLVTPSTSAAISSPNSSRTSSSEALVSSTVSCSSAAQSVSVSSRMPAQILATPTGWMMKSSPERRRWSAWCSQANTNARSTLSRRISWAASEECSSITASRSPSRPRSNSVRASVGPAGACGAAVSTGLWSNCSSAVAAAPARSSATAAPAFWRGRVARGLVARAGVPSLAGAGLAALRSVVGPPAGVFGDFAINPSLDPLWAA